MSIFERRLRNGQKIGDIRLSDLPRLIQEAANEYEREPNLETATEIEFLRRLFELELRRRQSLN